MNSRTEIQTHDCFTQKFKYFLLHLLPAKNNGVDVETRQEAGGDDPAYKICISDFMTSTFFLMVAGEALRLISTHSKTETNSASGRPQRLCQGQSQHMGEPGHKARDMRLKTFGYGWNVFKHDTSLSLTTTPGEECYGDGKKLESNTRDRFARLPYGLFQISSHILRLGWRKKKINKRFYFPKWET